MRRCAGCGELTEYSEPECRVCHYLDPGWAEILVRSGEFLQEPVFPEAFEVVSRLPQRGAVSSPKLIVVPVSSFSDSAELAYELSQIKSLADEGPSCWDIEVRFDFTQLGFDWEAAYDGEEHEFIPGSIGILALTEACRAIQFVWRGSRDLKLSALLPPRGHPASMLLLEAGLTSVLPPSSIVWQQEGNRRWQENLKALDLETIVPFTEVDDATFGQLSDVFHSRFDSLADRGGIGREYRAPIRQVVMGLAENGSEYGNGCYVGCFLRQEKGRAAGTKGRPESMGFDPRRHTHLFINCFTLGRSLAEVTGHKTEWEAAQVVLGGFTSRPAGGGSGMETIMRTVVESAMGTIYLNSKNYTRMVLPNGLVHEYTLGGDHYLPGVHICLLIPLAVVSQLRRTKSA